VAALLAAFTGFLLLLTRLLSAALLLLTRLRLHAALLLLPWRSLPALLLTLLIDALIMLIIFVRIGHLKYLFLQFNSLHLTTNPLITSYEKNPMRSHSSMFSLEQYRAKAAEYKKRGEQADTPDKIRALKDLERSFSELAENEEWMQRNSDKIVHSQPKDQEQE
jgi:hypothetical protein